MRIAVGGIEHETNTYCAAPTRLDDFYTRRGDEFFKSAGQESNVGGAVDACADSGVELVPLLHAAAQPSGTIERLAYDALKAELLSRLESALPVDACLLLVHGAGVVDGIDDLEADLAESVRQVVGDEVPIAATFDLHGNVTTRMADVLQGVFACRHYPHVDLHHRSHDAVRLLRNLHGKQPGQWPTCVVRSVPMLMPTTTTFEGSGQRMLEEVLQVEKDAGVVDVSWFHGFPYTDVGHVGSMMCVTAFDDGTAVADGIARALWNQRESFRPNSLSADEAVLRALELSGGDGPVVINETSDNCGGGSPGDGTHLLRAMIDHELGGRACFGFVVDAEVVAQAQAAGVGNRIHVSLGGKTDDLHGAPIEADAYVKSIADGRLVMQHMFKGAPLNIGPITRLVIDGVDVVVASRRSQTFDQEPFLAVGIDVLRYDIVALKSSNHFRAGFQHLASHIVTADPPGLTTHHIEVFPRQKHGGDLWPLREDIEFS